VLHVQFEPIGQPGELVPTGDRERETQAGTDVANETPSPLSSLLA
jgi:hypothetical protein